MSADDKITQAAEVALLAEGAAAGSSIHSWRCEYPDLYGKCDCVREAAWNVVAAVRPLILREAADAIENSSDARTCQVKRTCHEADVALLRQLSEAGDR